MFPCTPLLDHTTDSFLPICDHPAQIPLAFTLQPLMPLIGGVGDDPVVALLQNPTEVGSVIVPVDRNTACEGVQKSGGAILPEDIDGTVHMKVRGKRVTRCVEAGNAC